MNKNQNVEQLRCILCLIVFASHLQQAIGTAPFLELPVIRVFTDGGFAVSVFFVISGYYLTNSFSKGNICSVGDLIRFILKRWKRLYILPWFSILFAIALYLASPRMENGLTQEINNFWLTPLTPEYIIRNLIMIHYSGPSQLNPPLWTIAKEITMAVELPLLLIVAGVGRNEKKKLRIVILIALIIIMAVLNHYTPKVSYVYIFLIGALVNSLKDGFPSAAKKTIIVLGAVGFSLLCIPTEGVPWFASTAFRVMGLFLFVIPFWGNKIILPIDTGKYPLGELAFSFYLVHYPCILFWRFICRKADFVSYFTYALIVFVTALIATALFVWLGRALAGEKNRAGK